MEKSQGKLGLLESSTILIGGMVGSAIFSLSGITIMNAGPSAILSWIAAGVILFGYGLLNAELSTIYPNSGGVFTFPAKSLGKTPEQGRFWGWLSSWAYLCSCWGGAAFSAIYVGTYLSVAFPALAGLRVPLALLATLLCGVLNVFKISVTGKVSILLTGSLVLTMLLFIGVGLFGGQWDAALLTPFFTQGSQGSLGFLSTIPIAMVAYGSIVAVAFMVGEIKDPNKNVPRAMVIAMSIVIALYCLVMLTTLGLVTAGFLSENPDMTYIPLYAAAFTKLAHIPWLPALISVSATLALNTAMLVLIALASRTLQAAARSGILPKALGRNNAKTGVPLNATILVTVAFGALASFPMFTEFIINLGAMCNVIVVSIICVTVIAARRKNPGVKAFRAPGGNVMPILILIVLVTCYVPKILTGGWQLWVFTAGYLLVGLMVYFSGAKRRKSDKDLLNY
ncbi:MAG: APC family permease [Bacillota bacterium]